MDNEPYLLRLSLRLAEGLTRQSEDFRGRHSAFLRAAQNPDGGFSGREGGSDLYYTGFALRGLAVLDGLTPEVCDRAAGYLRHNLSGQASVIDFFSLLYACFLLHLAGIDLLGECPPDWPERVVAALESFRTSDGGYAKTAGGGSGSVYHTFLVGLCYQLLGKPLPQSEGLVRFIQSRRREDGGFVEIAPMRRSGTNPTAAAVGILQLVEAQERSGSILTPDIRAGVAGFLSGLVSPEGGLRGNGRAPVADLLSTFTGIWTLHQLAALDRIDAPAVLRYAQTLGMPEGGFRGGLWDEGTDVEYTFYGLGCLALLAVMSDE